MATSKDPVEMTIELFRKKLGMDIPKALLWLMLPAARAIAKTLDDGPVPQPQKLLKHPKVGKEIDGQVKSIAAAYNGSSNSKIA